MDNEEGNTNPETADTQGSSNETQDQDVDRPAEEAPSAAEPLQTEEGASEKAAEEIKDNETKPKSPTQDDANAKDEGPKEEDASNTDQVEADESPEKPEKPEETSEERPEESVEVVEKEELGKEKPDNITKESSNEPGETDSTEKEKPSDDGEGESVTVPTVEEEGRGSAQEAELEESSSPTKPESKGKSQYIDGIRVYESNENDNLLENTPVPLEIAETDSQRDTVPPPEAPELPTTTSLKGEVTFAPTEVSGDDANIITGNALNMVWSFGYNRNVPVINLTKENQRTIMYVCAHSGVCYDIENNTQKLLQGHSNAIACTCASEDKRWLATGDQGESNSLVILWNTANFIPVQTIFDVGDGGVAAIALTPDARYLVTISAAAPQVVAVWDWTTDGDSAVCSAQLDPAYGTQHYVFFNPADTTQIVSNSEKQVIFYNWGGAKMEYYAPSLTDDDFNKAVGKYTQSVFLEDSNKALTATSIGNIVVWDSNNVVGKAKSTKCTPDKKALKLVKIQDRGINVMMLSDGNLVLGDANGHVKFLDYNLNVLHWYQDLGVGPINSVSFTYQEAWNDMLKDVSSYPADTSLDSRPLVIRDFIVGATNAVVAHIYTKGTDIEIIHRDHDAGIWALATHPTSDLLCIASYSGIIQIWDYSNRVTVASRNFERSHMIQCASFDSQGQYLGIGFTNGSVRVLDAVSLLDCTERPLRYARDSITHLAFSHNGQLMAAIDAEFTTTLYKKLGPEDRDSWGYVGRHRAHYKPIVDMLFGVELDSDFPRLMTLGKDRTLVEYDLHNIDQDHLPLKSVDRIEQSAEPLCMTWAPQLCKENFILTANSEFKLKLYNTSTKMCRRTLLGPTYGSPVQRVKEIPTVQPEGVDPTRKYLAYINRDKVGMTIMPLDGNPHNSMCLVAHPEGVANLAVSHDGKYIFTAGGNDCSVHMWLVNLDALEAQSNLGGADMLPFYGLLEGGREGEMFRELEDYFYYAQLRSQGINTMMERKVATEIALNEVPFVMRAMGFYPSEQEVEDMLNEVKFSRYVETGKYVNSINLEDFLKLYLNHRPAFGLSMERLKQAFLTLSSDGSGEMNRGQWLSILQGHGEHMTEYELSECITTLLGFNPEGGSCEEHAFDASGANEIISETLPVIIDEQYFSNGLLGLDLMDTESMPPDAAAL